MTSLLRFARSRVFHVGLALAVLPLVPAEAQPPNIKPEFADKFPKAPSTAAGIFALRDSRAVGALQYINCMNTTIDAERNGVLGNVPSSALLACVEQKGTWRGVFGSFDATGSKFTIHAQLDVRGGGQGVRTTAPVDTTRVAAIARSMQRALNTPKRGEPRFSFTPVPLHYDTYVDVLFVPVQNSAAYMYVGGDSVIQMTQDGVREQGHTTTSPKPRTVPMPSGQEFVLESSEAEVPLISELMVARLALARVPSVRVRTKKFESVLSIAVNKWVHTPRKSP